MKFGRKLNICISQKSRISEVTEALKTLEKETINHLLTAMKRGLHRESEDFLADIYFQICLF